MRILGQIPHPQILISVFKSNNKFILKFEIGPFEQTYKFIESSDIHSYESVSALVTDVLLQNVFKIFDEMNLAYNKVLGS